MSLSTITSKSPAPAPAPVASHGLNDVGRNIERMSVEQIEREIESTWYRHLELRNEVYEKVMGPSDILDVYVSCQKCVRLSTSMKDLQSLLETNFQYHMKLRSQFYFLKNGSKQPLSSKAVYYYMM